MTGNTFVTDFSSLFNIVSAGRDLPGASRLLAQTRYPAILENVDELSVRLMVSILSEDINAVKVAMEDIARLHVFFQDRLGELQDKVFEYGSLLAPIRRLPVEILQEIFRFLRADSEAFKTQRHRNVPPAFSQVNRHWRHVAFATPSLWTTPVLTLGTEQTSSQVESMAWMMTRSHPLPVSLFIRTSTAKLPHRYMDAHESERDEIGLYEEDFEVDDDYDDYLSEIETQRQERVQRNNGRRALALRLEDTAKHLAKGGFEPYLHRLSSITMFRYSDAFQSFINHFGEGDVASSLTQLESLVLPATTWAEQRSMPFGLAPRLKRLCLHSTSLGGATPFTQLWEAIPWYKLVAFRGQLSSSELVACFCSNSETLRTAEITVQKFAPFTPRENPAHSPLRNLTSLYVRAVDIEVIHPLPLLPALRHLFFQPDCLPSSPSPFQPSTSGIDPRTGILFLLKAWGPQLDYLGIDIAAMSHRNTLSESALDDIILTVPNLEALGLPSYRSPALTRVISRLDRLLHVEMFDPVTYHTALQKIPCSTLSRLQTLTFLEYCNGTATLSIEYAERKAQDQGLSVVISRQPVHGMMRFSTPYFVQQGGVFVQCLSDEMARQRDLMRDVGL